MLFSCVWTAFFVLSLLASFYTGRSGLSSATLAGAQKGVSISVGLCGAVCLWSGIAAIMEAVGLKEKLGRLFLPLLGRIFPEMGEDSALAGSISGNFCANLLGLGNAATPMGVDAAKRLARKNPKSDSLCRLVVLNTASIQLIPATVAGIRASLGCKTPFDILPAVWVTSLCSAGLGLAMAFLLGKLWKD